MSGRKPLEFYINLRAPSSTPRRPAIKPNALIYSPINGDSELKWMVTVTLGTPFHLLTLCPMLSGASHFAERPECVCQWNCTTVTGMRGHRWHAETRVHKKRSTWPSQSRMFTMSCSAKQGVSRGIPNRGLYSPCSTISRKSFASPGSLCYWLAPEARIRSSMQLSFILEDSHHS